MSSISFFQYFQIFFSIAIAFIITYRIRKPIRAVIVQMMPVKQRVSDDFFHIQTRIGLVVGVIVALIIAFITYMGLEVVERQFSEKKVEQGGFVKPSVYEETEPVAVPKTMPPNESDEQDLDAKEDLPPENPSEAEEKEESPAVQNNPERTSSRSETGRWYLQINAFDVYDNAVRQYETLRRELDRTVWLVVAPGERGLYKVLIGPFPDRAALRRYRSRHQLQGWPRHREGLRVDQVSR